MKLRSSAARSLTGSDGVVRHAPLLRLLVAFFSHNSQSFHMSWFCRATIQETLAIAVPVVVMIGVIQKFKIR